MNIQDQFREILEAAQTDRCYSCTGSCLPLRGYQIVHILQTLTRFRRLAANDPHSLAFVCEYVCIHFRP